MKVSNRAVKLAVTVGATLSLLAIHAASAPVPFPEFAAPRAVTQGPHDHFLANYFGINAWSPDNRYLLALETDLKDELPDGRPCTLGLVDLGDGNRFIPVMETRCWNFQEAAMAHWLPNERDCFVVNDLRDGKFVAVVKNWRTGAERIVPHPVSAVSEDGTWALSINYARLYLTRPDYGYWGEGQDPRKNVVFPEDDGLWRIDLKTGEAKLIVSCAALKGVVPAVGASGLSYICHTVISKDMKRVFFLSRSVSQAVDEATKKKGVNAKWATTAFTCNADGTCVRRIFPDGWGSSHFNWKPALSERDARTMAVTCHWEGERVCRHAEFTVGEESKAHKIGGETMHFDGHCIYSPDGNFITGDGYWDRNHKRHWKIVRLADEEIRDIGDFFVPSAYRNIYCRCDLHPRWRPDGRQLAFNSVHEGSRQIYLIDVKPGKAGSPAGQLVAAEGAQRPSEEMRIEREVEAACGEIDEGQATLSDRCSLADYRALVRTVNGTNMWTAALQKALDEHEIVTIPASGEKYFFDGTVIVPSRRRIEATGATVRLADGMCTVLLRNASAQDGTLAPIPASATRDTDIAIVGGRWEDWCTRRAGYGRTGMFNLLPRRKGNYFGVSTLFFFNKVNRLSVTGSTFHHTGGFAVQVGDGDAVAFRDISFDRCFADGLHLNGNLTRVLARNVRGQVGDDLVALNAYDWLNSSVDFGPQRYILCEDLELVRLPGVSAYPAIRIQPAKYRYADGSIVDCAISDVIFRRVKGITTYKMYLQTPRYTIGSTPEWAEVGSGGNLFFSDLEIDLDAPIDKIGQYATQEAPRGHFAAFEFGANLSLVHFKNIDITFHADKWPLTHFVQVGPKSCSYPGKDGKPGMEIFDPYVNCRVERVVLENVRVHGTPPAELVYSAAFDDINKDGRSTGRGVIEEIDR